MEPRKGGQRGVRLRGLVEGQAEAPVTVLDRPLSFYGEVDPETGRLYNGDTVAGRILVLPSTRGSTVGPYVLYSLSKHGAAPAGIVVVRAEPLLVAGAVLAETPLAEGMPAHLIRELKGRKCRGRLVSRPPAAELLLECS